MITSILRKTLIPSTNFIFGFADLRGLLGEKYCGYNYGISVGKKLDDKIVDRVSKGPTLEYYEHYRNINRDLAELSRKLVSELKEVGIGSMDVPPTIHPGSRGYQKYLKTLTYDLSHKMVATRAGLGWIGKTDLFISRDLGPRLRLVTILLKEDPGIQSVPVNKSKCGKCNICVVKCPAKAATGRLWDISVHRDEFFNAKKCRETCGRVAKEMLNVDERICGLCVSVCPVGKRIRN